ncbi:MAG: protoglobin domain-containing protein [Thalassobaculum sp.]|uniref:protoglobin domain-containing protein n=1 Tax=Thalassobaculum sp. TaxID=2022740 RepID=UPI0032ED7A6E
MTQPGSDGSTYEHVFQHAVERILDTIPRRLILDGIDDDTRAAMAQFVPIFEENIGGIVGSFYRHVLQFPETRHFLESVSVDYLKKRQVEHWRGLLSCKFDEAYIKSAVAVGLKHHKIGLPLYLYLSGCNRILCDLTSLSIMHHAGAMASSQTVSSIIKVVALDMDITISCYFVADRLRMPSDEGRGSRKLVSRP